MHHSHAVPRAQHAQRASMKIALAASTGGSRSGRPQPSQLALPSEHHSRGAPGTITAATLSCLGDT